MSNSQNEPPLWHYIVICIWELSKLLFVLSPLIFFIGILIGLFIPITIDINTSSERIGYITSVKGGWLRSEYHVKSDLTSSQELTYCLENDQNDIKGNLEKAAEQRKRIKIVTHGYSTINLWKCTERTAQVNILEE